MSRKKLSARARRGQLKVLLTSLALITALSTAAAAQGAGAADMEMPGDLGPPPGGVTGVDVADESASAGTRLVEKLSDDSAPATVEGQLRSHLEGRFEKAFVSVRGVSDNLVDAVVTVLPSENDTRAYAREDANLLAEELRDQVLRAGGGEMDFRTGSQFSILGPEKFQVQGAGEELTKAVERVALDVIREVTRRGLALQYLSASGYSGPQLALEVQARGVDLGPEERIRQRELLEQSLQQDLMGRKYTWMAYLPEQSFVEVWDAERPPDVIEWIPALPEEAGQAPEPPPPGGDTGRWWEKPSEPEDSIPLTSWPEIRRGQKAFEPRTPDVPSPDMTEPAGPEPIANPVPVSREPVAPEPLAEPLDPVMASNVPATSVPIPVGGSPVDASWAPDAPAPRDLGRARRPFTGATPDELIPPSRAELAPPSRRAIEPGALARRLREIRARTPWIPPPPGEAELREPAEREPPRSYPAAPFAIGPGVASCEVFVRFDTDKAYVKPEEREKLRGFLEEVPAKRIRGVTIVGHADSRNTNPYNLGLGRRRAEAVKRFLVGEGVKEVRVVTRTMGEEQPLMSNLTDHGRSVNRRAVLEVTFADPDRPMHADRSPFWRKGRSLPAPPRHDSRGRRKPYDGHWPQRWTPKWSPDSGEE